MHIPRGGLEDDIYIEYPIQGEMEGEKLKRICSMGYYAPINNIYSNNDNLVKVSISVSLHNKEIVQESDINLVLDTGPKSSVQTWKFYTHMFVGQHH